MVLPSTISDASPLDPLLLLPVPSLPPSPLADLDPLISTLTARLSADPAAADGGKQIPVPALTAAMRSITRQSQILLNAARVGMAQSRERLDDVDVDLRGVEYERERVREEIERCSEYAPAYKSLDLPDIDSFLASVDDETRSALPSQDDNDYEYALTIARLENELKEIQKREARVAQLTKDRDALIKAKKEIKIKFDAVDVHLTGFSRSANAVASKLKDVADLPAAAVSVPISASTIQASAAGSTTPIPPA